MVQEQKIFLKISFFFVFPFFIFSQKNPFKKNIIEGNKLLLEHNYNEALIEFQKAYTFDSANPYLNYKMGLCYLLSTKNKNLAENFLEKSLKAIVEETDDNDPDSQTAPTMAIYYYGIALHLGYKFRDAIKNFENYRAYVPSKYKEENELISYQIQLCKNAIERLENPTKIKIKNIGNNINDNYTQTAPRLHAETNTLYYTASSPYVSGARLGTLNRLGTYFDDIFYSKEINDSTWEKFDTIPGFINTAIHESSPTFGNGGKDLIFSKGDDNAGDLFLSRWDSTDWLVPVKLSENLNTKYNERSPCLSTDGNTLFFISDRPGGFGGFDVYRSKKLPNGKWGKAENMGQKINTKYDEESPFPFFENNELFFSSKGHSTMGGFDIFKINLDSNLNPLGQPVALSYPINTTSDDIYFNLTPDNQFAFYASDIETNQSHGSFDIYKVQISNQKEANDLEKKLVIYKGHVSFNERENISPKISIHVYLKNNNELYGRFRPNEKGDFISNLKAGNTFIFSYLLEGKQFYAEELTVADSILGFEIEKKDTIIHNFKKTMEVSKERKTNNQKNISLQVRVIELKNFQPERGAKVQIKENETNGKSQEFFTDQNGIVDSIKIESGKKYTLRASFREFMGEEENIDTKNEKGKNLSKTLYVSTSTETYNTDSLIHGRFIHYFEFNLTEIGHFRNYRQFLDSVDANVKRYGEITIAVKASASNLPTNFKGGLTALSKKRATDFQKGLIKYFIENKKDPKKIKFELSFSIGGPPFVKDYRKKLREYEKYQFVEAYIKPFKKKSKK